MRSSCCSEETLDQKGQNGTLIGRAEAGCGLCRDSGAQGGLDAERDRAREGEREEPKDQEL